MDDSQGHTFVHSGSSDGNQSGQKQSGQKHPYGANGQMEGSTSSDEYTWVAEVLAAYTV